MILVCMSVLLGRIPCSEVSHVRRTTVPSRSQHRQGLSECTINYTVSQNKFPPLNYLKMSALLESVWNPYDITHLTLGMLLHYLRKLKRLFFCRYLANIGENANKLWYFQCLKQQVFLHTDCKYNFQCHCSFSYLLLRSISGTRNLTQQTSLQCLSTVNVVFSDENKILIKKVCIWRGTQQISWRTNFLRKAGQSMVLISCWKTCGTQAQLTEPRNAHTTTGSFESHAHFTKK